MITGNEKGLKKLLIAKRRNVKAKLEQLKHGEMVHESMFNPITKHLKNIESTLEKTTRQGNEKQHKQQQDEIPDVEPTETEPLIEAVTPAMKKYLKSPKPKRLSFSPETMANKRHSTASSKLQNNVKETLVENIDASDIDDDYDLKPVNRSSSRFENIAELPITWISMNPYPGNTFVRCMKMWMVKKRISSMVYVLIQLQKNSRLVTHNWI